MASYKVESPHLNLARDILKAIDVPAKDILSGKSWEAPTQWSYERGAPILIPVQDARGNVTWKNITSNNVWTADDVPRNGYFAAENSEGVARGKYHFPSIDGWRDGIKSPAKT